MPHPERGLVAPGSAIFESVYAFLTDKKSKRARSKVATDLPIDIKNPKVTTYKSKRNTLDIYIELLITDNEEFTLQHTFDTLNLAPVNLKKYRFVSISAKKKLDEKTILKMIRNDYFVNSQKELCYIQQKKGWYTVDKSNKFKVFDEGILSAPALRVNYIEDTIGQSLVNKFKKKFKANAIFAVSTGVVWEFQNKPDSRKKLTKTQLKELLTHRLFWNPHSQEAQLIE